MRWTLFLENSWKTMLASVWVIFSHALGLQLPSRFCFDPAPAHLPTQLPAWTLFICLPPSNFVLMCIYDSARLIVKFPKVQLLIILYATIIYLLEFYLVFRYNFNLCYYLLGFLPLLQDDQQWFECHMQSISGSIDSTWGVSSMKLLESSVASIQ